MIQRFNKFGEAIEDPTMLAQHISPADTLHIQMWNSYLDNNDNIHVLWRVSVIRGGPAELKYSMINSEGETIVNGVSLQGIRILISANDKVPQLAVTSDSVIVVLDQIITSDGGSPIAYGRFSMDGELIDSLHILRDEEFYSKTFRLEVGPGDTLHMSWQENGSLQQGDPHRYSVCYYKIAPDDEIIVNDFRLPRVNWDRGILLADFTVDSTNNPVFVELDNDDYYVSRLNSELERDFYTYIGSKESGSRSGDVQIDPQGNIHVIDDFEQENFNEGRYSIGYVQLDPNGNIADTLQLIHDPRGGAYWSRMSVWVTSDNTVGLVWNDNSYNDRDNGGELVMRYSIIDVDVVEGGKILNPSEFIILSAHPNPFNSTVKIGLDLNHPDQVNVQIFDLHGRQVALLNNSRLNLGSHTFMWDARSFATGTYTCRVKMGEQFRNVKVLKMN